MVSKASDSTAKLGRSHGEQSDDSSGSLTHKMHQLKKQIQGERIVSIKEKIERNGKKLERYVSDILSATSRSAEEGCNGKLLSSRIEQPLYKLSGLAQGYGDKDHVNSHDVLSPSSTKLPYVEKLPPYTTWIFLERNQRMADDQSVVGRRRIYYDNEHGSEALICSDSEEDVAEPEEVKREFTSAEDKIISTIFGEFGIGEAVVNAVSNFIGADGSEVQEKYNTIKERNQQKQDSKGSGKFGFYKGISLDKSLMAALDSFDKLFCRRCKQFDCHQHGCSQRVIYPSEKQAYWSEHDEDRKPCSEHCYLKLRILEHLPKASNANLVHENNDTSDRENNPASEAHSDHANKKVMNDEICAPAVLDAINTSEVADRSQNVDTSVMAMHYEDKVKRKAMEDRDSNPDDLKRFSDYIQNSCKKQKSLAVSDVESRTSEHILTHNGNSSAKSGHLDVDKCATNETPMTTKNSGSASCDKFGDKIQNELDDALQVDVIKQPSRSMGQVQAVHSSSEWKQMEKDLYMKGLEIFGRNSCLIARNLLSGLKTCLEVSMYMYEGGVSVPHRSAIGPSSSMEDNGKTDTEHTDHEMATKSRLIRRRGKARKLKYSWKSAGPPSIWKRIADGKTQSCNQYTPCSCESMCGRECTCMQNGTCCEKYCGCSKSCKNRFRGCHCAKSQCRSRQCPCFAAGRECDPDVCRNCWVSCGDGSLEEPPRQGDGHCGNMRLLLKQQQKILLAKSDVAGWGAFLKNPVNKNDYLGEYTGELISHREADKRGKIYDRANSSFLFDLNDQYVLDAYRKGDKLKFANHSSNPNCYAKVMLVAGDHRVGIFAKERIEASEELFYDYRYGPDQAPAWARKPENSKRDDFERPQGRAKKHQSH